MRSWPTVVIPPLNHELPPLKLRLTSGKLENSSAHFRMYVCGITPYDATHLGHAATYLTFDLINRYTQLQNRKVSFVENITDIDDPLLVRAERDATDWQSLATSQIELYAGDMSALRILPPEYFESVTQSMELIVLAVTKVIDAGFTYSLDGDIYFRSKDFKPNEPGWPAPFGFGRPGWHIECSVIALRYLLGADYLESKIDREFCIDLQGGGSDLIFPHHFMSAILAKVLTGKPFAAGYLHTGMVGLDGEKMSKSKGNLVFVSKLLKSGVDPMVIRFALLQNRYSSDRMWTDDVLHQATLKVAKLRSALARMEVAQTSTVIDGVISALSDDLDTPKALELLDVWASNTELAKFSELIGSAGELSRALDSLLGLAL